MTVHLCETFVWVLVHSLWQGIVIAAGVAGVLRWLPARRTEARYASGLTGLGLVILSALVTWSVMTLEPATSTVRDSSTIAQRPTSELPSESVTPPEPVRNPAVQIASSSAATGVTPSPVANSTATHNWPVWLAAIWFAGASLMLFRSIVAVVQVRQWRGTGTEPSHETLQRLIVLKQELCERLGLRRLVRMVVSDRVNVPAVIGTLWPCVLIPPALLTGIPFEHWRVILAHELAHIRRFDFLVNLVQMVVESLFFFNPAVWWISHQIRVEREACCDAMAVQICGQPLSVARTLVEFAAEIRGEAKWAAGSNVRNAAAQRAASMSVMAFADESAPGELTDRVQRLVDPEIAARPRISWIGLGVILSSLVIVVLALQWGTSLAVRTAARLISPQERVARLERLQSEAEGVFFPPEPAEKPANTDKAAANTGAETAKTSGNIEVTLVVRTADGKPIPKGLELRSHTQTGSSTGGTSLGVGQHDSAEHRKVLNFGPCKLRLGATAPGYASVASPVLNLFPGDGPKTVELILERGSSAKLKLHDHQGRPIVGVTGRLEGKLSIGGGTLGLGVQDFTSDEAGIATLEHLGDVPYMVYIRAPGFEQHELTREFKPGEIVDTEMTKAVAVKFQVVDGATGKPVENARFVIARRTRSDNTFYYSDPRRVQATDRGLNYAVSDADGRVVLDDLKAGTQYSFGVVAPGYVMSVVDSVTSGQDPRVVKLGQPLKLFGQIDGSLELLNPQQAKNAPQSHQIFYTSRVNSYISNSDYASVDAEGKFEIDNLMPGEQLTFSLGDRREEIVVTQPRTDVILKLVPPNAPAFPKRDVIIRLTGTSPKAPARGNLYVRFQHPDPACRDFQNGQLPLQANEIHLKAPIGAKLGYEPYNLVGYGIDPREEIPIVAGADAQIIEVPTKPAGGVHGKITRADGTPAENAHVLVFATRLPPGEKDHSRINAGSGSSSSSYLATLPLGGRYRILARELNERHSVWAVSNEITLTETQPIAEMNMQLPAGRPLPVKVLDQAGKPLGNQLVVLQLDFTLPRVHSNGTSVSRTTGPDGVAIFENVSFDAPVSPLTCTMQVEVAHPQHLGWRETINPKRPVEIHLQRGSTATGVLIEAKSGKPIPNADVRLSPREYGKAKFKGILRLTTDAKGEFRAESLEPIEYTAYIDETSPKGAILTPFPDGGLRISLPAGVEQHKLNGRSSRAVRWEVIIHPNSRLKPVE